jgi:hypothetical protein
MDAIAEVADGYYSNDLRGGEGHMEVGKLIMNVVHNKCHMTVSVKPFGCMPSSGVSDGVQSLITTKYPGTIFCAVETSGDGATNFYSRVQMYMYKARIAAEQELAEAYVKAGVTEAEVRSFLDRHPEYASPLHHSPHAAAGSAANLVYEVAPLIKLSARERAARAVRQGVTSASQTVTAVPAKVRRLAAMAGSKEIRQGLKLDAGVALDVLRGKAADHYGPLVKRLMGRAYWENNPEAPSIDEPLAAE